MLRYILLKLSGITGKKEFSISSSCNQMLKFRPTSTMKGEQFRRDEKRNNQPRKRSYSFPTRSTKSCRFLENDSMSGIWTKSEPQEYEGLNLVRKKSFHQNLRKVASTTSMEQVKSEQYSTAMTTKKQPKDKSSSKSKYHDAVYVDKSQIYELEAAKPRRSQSELVFNVFDYVAKDVDLTDYLQPSNLRPFGSHDNIYLPLLVSHKNIPFANNNPNYLDSSPDLPGTTKTVEVAEEQKPEVTQTVEKIAARDSQKNTNKIKKANSKELKPYKEIIRKHKELHSTYMPKAVKSTDGISDMEKTSINSDVIFDRSTSRRNEIGQDKEPLISRHLSGDKPAVKFEPPPFISTADDRVSSTSFADFNFGSKRSIGNYTRVQPPWPAYSDRIKEMTKRSLVTYPPGCSPDDPKDEQNKQPKVALSQQRSMSTENVRKADDSLKGLKNNETLPSSMIQRRTLSMNNLSSNIEDLPVSLTEEPPKTLKSSIYVSKNPIKTPLAQSSVSLNTRSVTISTNLNYANSSNMIRKLEPKSCKPPEKKKKCFLPSKVRLQPPICTPKPKPCPMEPPCPPRADDSLKVRPKKLPCLTDQDCECMEPMMPNQNPKLKRLRMKFVDEPRICPCVPIECPCPPPPRADDTMIHKEKKLIRYKPANCECIDPPRMVHVPLIRLQKKCDPPAVCYPPEPMVCPEPEPCIRADDFLKETPKTLPTLSLNNCSCVEPLVPKVSPKIRRLKFEFTDPPRICPCEPMCECPEIAPIRIDSLMEEKVKKLQPLRPSPCECIDPPPMVDVPLKRLQKVCLPDVCHPVRICPVEKCEDKIRADMYLVEKPKPLPKLKPSKCECMERYMPNQNPKVRRLHMKFEDEPRVCPCVPIECPCPPPVRADDSMRHKEKKLVLHIPKECACIDSPPMVDVPLVRLQKVCEPPEVCRPPPKMCVVVKCEDRERADDSLIERPKKLPLIEPKDCPCTEHKMKQGPKLKRLSLSVPEPPRICPPVKECPPPAEKCWRADECVPEKIKKLRPIKPGDCPCIDTPMVDVKPLARLKCKEEPEECLKVDPCLVDHPRADYGCWEYLEDVKPLSKEEKCKMKQNVNYKQKRKYNTDSTVYFSKSSSVNDKVLKLDINNRRNLSTESRSKNARILRISKHFSNTKTNVSGASRAERYQLLQGSKSALPRNMNKLTSMSSVMKTDHDRNVKVSQKKTVEGIGNKSLPTLLLLKDLDEMEGKKVNRMIHPTKTKNSKIDLILQKLTPTKHHRNSILNTSIRELSTVVNSSPKKIANSGPGFIQASSSSGSNYLKNNKEIEKRKKESKKACNRLKTCPGPMIMENCPTKEQRNKNCNPPRPLICCDKKETPNPAFSECMDGEIEPFSNTNQWACRKQEYGFDPKPKKIHEPLDTVRDKKKFSTCSTPHRNASGNRQIQHVENPIVSYFTARYAKSVADGQWKKNVGTTYESNLGGVQKKVGCKEDKRSTSTIVNDIINGTNGCRIPNKDFNSLEEKSSKLLTQKSNYTVAGVNCKKMFVSCRGCGGILYNNNSGLVLLPHANVDQSILRRHISMLNNKTLTYTTDKIVRRQCSGKFDDKSFYRKEYKKKVCEKFELENCPEKGRNTCKRVPPQIICNQRPQAPYPSFSELMDEEMEERMTECPIEKERVAHLQPKYPIPLEKPKILEPVVPQQGRIDPRIEETCIRERLCLENEGLTQDCTTFGEYLKPLRSKNFFKQKNKDCDKIEELKRLGKWPPRNTRRFSTNSGLSSTHYQDREFCSFAPMIASAIINPKKEEYSKENDNIENEKEARSYHALCKKPQDDNIMEEIKKEVNQIPMTELDEPCKYTKLRNVQWGTNNFQKWHRLDMFRNPLDFTKKYHTCSKLKYRTFVKHKQQRHYMKHLRTLTPVENFNSSFGRGVLCTKLKNIPIKRYRTPHCFSTTAIKTSADSFDVSIQRGISTTTILQKKKIIRFPLYPKPMKNPNTPKRAEPQPIKALTIPRTSYEKPKSRPVIKKKPKALQPRYPCVPEVDTVSMSSSETKEGSTWEKDSFPDVQNKEKKYKSYDCSAVSEPFIQLNSSSSQPVKSEASEFVKVNETGDDQNMATASSREVFMQNNKVAKKPRQHVRKAWMTKICPKIRNPCPCDSKKTEPPPKPKPKPLPKKESSAIVVCPPVMEIPKEMLIAAKEECETAAAIPPAEECPPKIEYPTSLTVLWQKVVHYFKARPNCPSPEEWKKKALREKAEKAAKAAGLCLFDPKSLPQSVPMDNSDEEDPKKPNSKSSGNPNCFQPNKHPCKMSRRCYSSSSNWDKCDDLLEDEKKKRLMEQVSKVFMDDVNLANDDDANQICPDAFFENTLNEAILKKNSLTCLEKSWQADADDRCLSYSLKIVPSNINVLDDALNEPLTDLNRFSHSSTISDFQEYFSRMDTLSESTYEEIEREKTKTLVKELDKLLTENKKSNKKK